MVMDRPPTPPIGPVTSALRPAAMARPPVLVIAGPTASGKSGLALEVADAFSGTIINADSLQIYRDLRILTARPDETAEARVPHRLYGFLDASERGSVARWRALALDGIAGAIKAGRIPVLVGGSDRGAPPGAKPPGDESSRSTRAPVVLAGRSAARRRDRCSAARYPEIRQAPNDLVSSPNGPRPDPRCATFGKFAAPLTSLYR